MWNHIHSTGSWQGEIWNKRKNGDLYAQYILIASVRDEKGQTTHYVASITDISAYKASEEKVRLLALYDSLTKLPNRRLFLEHLEQSIQDAEMKKQLGILLCIDLDNFKALNDTKGYETGDHLLQQVAARLLECVGANHMIARLGGMNLRCCLIRSVYLSQKPSSMRKWSQNVFYRRLLNPISLKTQNIAVLPVSGLAFLECRCMKMFRTRLNVQT
jgi:diguanylate cyclase (GGDEF)-like protein